MNFSGKFSAVAVSTGIFAIWAMFTDHVPPGYAGIAYDSVSGIVTIQEKPGWYLTSPLTCVMRVDTKPMRVTPISLANIITSRLVRFKKEGATEFLKLQGFGYMYPFRQKLIMVGYAYSGREYSFIEVLETPGAQ